MQGNHIGACSALFSWRKRFGPPSPVEAERKRRPYMDQQMDKEHVRRALEEMGLDIDAERLQTEAYHLISLFNQGQTITDALYTVTDLDLRRRLKPMLYYITLRALTIALARLQSITLAQADDLNMFVREQMQMQASPSRQDSLSNNN